MLVKELEVRCNHVEDFSLRNNLKIAVVEEESYKKKNCVGGLLTPIASHNYSLQHIMWPGERAMSNVAKLKKNTNFSSIKICVLLLWTLKNLKFLKWEKQKVVVELFIFYILNQLFTVVQWAPAEETRGFTPDETLFWSGDGGGDGTSTSNHQEK